MNFSGVPSEKLPGRLLRLPLRMIPPEAKMPVLQGPLKGRRWIAGSHTHGCGLGSYENDKQRAFGRRVARGAVVFDVGANVGYYSLLASALVGDSGHVVALEPLPRNLHYLRQHLEINGIHNVTVLDAAVADADGNLTFDPGPNAAMGQLHPEGTLVVRAVSLDNLVRRHEAPAPDVIKIDVEGAELRVLSGARSLLSEKRPVIFLATHGAELHAECCSFLTSVGYRLEPIGAEAVEDCDELVAS